MGKANNENIVDVEIKVGNLNNDLAPVDAQSFHQRFIKYLRLLDEQIDTCDKLKSLNLMKQIEILKINEIDEEIEVLNRRRLKSLDIISVIEQRELKQNNIEKSETAEIMVDKPNSNDRILEKIIEETINTKPNATERNTEHKTGFASQILPKNNAKHNQTEFLRNKSTRKITPVLQNYYKPLSLIKSHTFSNDCVKLLDFDIPFGMMFAVTTAQPAIVTSKSLSNKLETDDKDGSGVTASACVKEYTGHKSSINCIQYKSNTLVTGAKDAIVNVYNCGSAFEENSSTENVEPVALLDSHIDEVTCLSYDGHVLVSGSQDRTVRQWDLNKMCCINTLDLNFIRNYYQLDNTSFSSASVTPGNNSWLSGNGGMRSRSDSIISRSTSVFDIHAIINGTNNYGEHSSDVVSTPNDMSGHSSDSSFVFDMKAQSPLIVPKFISSLQVYDAALATGTSDGVVRLWDIRAQRIMRQLPSNVVSSSDNTSICDMKFDSHQLLTTNYSNELLIWDLRMGKVLKMLKIGNNAISGAGTQFEMDKKKLVIKDNNTGIVYLYDRKNNEFIDWKEKTEQNELSNVESMRLKGGYLLEGYKSGIVKSWAV
ncbi:hypothetical protein QEN19_003340 [Hanseniaspora menglaensis]